MRNQSMPKEALKMNFTARLQSLGFNTYKEYLASDHWSEFSKSYRQSPDTPKVCRCCGFNSFQLHHKTYERLGNESFDDIAPMCRYCHKELHKAAKKYKISISNIDECIKAVQQGLSYMPPFVRMTKKNSTKKQRKAQARMRRNARREIIRISSINTMLVNCDACHRRAWQDGKFCCSCGAEAVVLKTRR